jgi:hypothetical protein
MPLAADVATNAATGPIVDFDPLCSAGVGCGSLEARTYLGI